MRKVKDMLDYMTRKQLEATAKEEGVRHSRYPTKIKLIAAIRRRREASVVVHLLEKIAGSL